MTDVGEGASRSTDPVVSEGGDVQGQPGQAGQAGSPPGGEGGRGGRGGVGRRGRRGIPGRTSLLPVIGYLILAAGIVIGFVQVVHVSSDNRAFAHCVSRWANDTAARTAVLTPANLDRQDKLDSVIRDFRLAQSTDPKIRAKLRVTFFADINRYIKASDKYRSAAASNPLPAAPKFTCGGSR